MSSTPYHAHLRLHVGCDAPRFPLRRTCSSPPFHSKVSTSTPCVRMRRNWSLAVPDDASLAAGFAT